MLPSAARLAQGEKLSRHKPVTVKASRRKTATVALPKQRVHTCRLSPGQVGREACGTSTLPRDHHVLIQATNASSSTLPNTWRFLITQFVTGTSFLQQNVLALHFRAHSCSRGMCVLACLIVHHDFVAICLTTHYFLFFVNISLSLVYCYRCSFFQKKVWIRLSGRLWPLCRTYSGLAAHIVDHLAWSPFAS